MFFVNKLVEDNKLYEALLHHLDNWNELTVRSKPQCYICGIYLRISNKHQCMVCNFKLSDIIELIKESNNNTDPGGRCE